MKKHAYITAIGLLCISGKLYSQEVPEICDCPSQTKVGNGTFYFSWGYNRDWFTKSDIHFTDNTTEFDVQKGQTKSYDFTIYDVTARDRPGIKDIFRTDLTIPQYNYRLGYFFNNKKDFGIEINFDHTKYIMEDNQTRRVKGTIHGQNIDQDTLIDPKTFLHFEHSDGANFLMLNFVKRQNLFVSKNKKHWLGAVAKIGAGPVIPRTEVTLFGENLNNRFHVAGYCIGAEVGLRYDVFKHIYLEYTAKGVWANYTDVLVIGTGKAHHHFGTFENILVLGYEFAL